MSFILRLPSVTAPDNEGKIEQIRTYLYTIIKDINWALNSLDSTKNTEVQSQVVDGNTIFSVVKPLIIKSSDIIDAYYNIFKGRMDDEYASALEFNRLNVWFRIDDINNIFEIGRMVDGEFVSMMTFKEGNIDIKPYKGTHKHSSVIGSIKYFSQNCDEGMTPIVTNSETLELPEGYVDCVGIIQKMSASTVIQITDAVTGSMATNILSNGVWSGWKHLIPE